MLRIIIESSRNDEKAIGWIEDILKFKGTSFSKKKATLYMKGNEVAYKTIFEKK